jgi:hypothetical protein
MLKYQTIQNCKYDEIWKVLNYKLQSFLAETITPGETRCSYFIFIITNNERLSLDLWEERFRTDRANRYKYILDCLVYVE